MLKLPSSAAYRPNMWDGVAKPVIALAVFVLVIALIVWIALMIAFWPLILMSVLGDIKHKDSAGGRALFNLIGLFATLEIWVFTLFALGIM